MARKQRLQNLSTIKYRYPELLMIDTSLSCLLLLFFFLLHSSPILFSISPPPAFNWSVDDVLSWLESSVELPQYGEVFRKHNITGRHLPRWVCVCVCACESVCVVSVRGLNLISLTQGQSSCVYRTRSTCGFCKHAKLNIMLAFFVG